MDKDILKKAAEILVERRYADKYEIDKRDHLQHDPPIILIQFDSVVDNFRIECGPFSDTLEGRRQADAIEDWLETKEPKTWLQSRGRILMIEHTTRHQWRLDRIKWCLQELSNG